MRVVIEPRRDSVCKSYVSSDLLSLFQSVLEKKDRMRVISIILRFVSAETSIKNINS